MAQHLVGRAAREWTEKTLEQMNEAATEAVIEVLRKNSMPEDEIDAARLSLGKVIVPWIKKNYHYQPAEVAWPCADCRKNRVVCEACINNAVIEEDVEDEEWPED